MSFVISFRTVVSLYAITFVIMLSAALYPTLLTHSQRQISKMVHQLVVDRSSLTAQILERALNKTVNSVLGSANATLRIPIPKTADAVATRQVQSMLIANGLGIGDLNEETRTLLCRYSDASLAQSTIVLDSGRIQIHESSTGVWTGVATLDQIASATRLRFNTTTLEQLPLLPKPLLLPSRTFVNGIFWNTTNRAHHEQEKNGNTNIKIMPIYTRVSLGPATVDGILYPIMVGSFLPPTLDEQHAYCSAFMKVSDFGARLRHNLVGGDSARAFLVDFHGNVVSFSHGSPFHIVELSATNNVVYDNCFPDPFAVRMACMYNVSTHGPYALLKSAWAQNPAAYRDDLLSGRVAQRSFEIRSGDDNDLFFVDATALRTPYRLFSFTLFLFAPEDFFTRDVMRAQNVAVGVSVVITVAGVVVAALLLRRVAGVVEDLSLRMQDPWNIQKKKENSGTASAASEGRESSSTLSSASLSFSPRQEDGQQQDEEGGVGGGDSSEIAEKSSDSTATDTTCWEVLKRKLEGVLSLPLAEVQDMEEEFEHFAVIVQQMQGFMLLRANDASADASAASLSSIGLNNGSDAATAAIATSNNNNDNGLKKLIYATKGKEDEKITAEGNKATAATQTSPKAAAQSPKKKRVSFVASPETVVQDPPRQQSGAAAAGAGAGGGGDGDDGSGSGSGGSASASDTSSSPATPPPSSDSNAAAAASSSSSSSSPLPTCSPRAGVVLSARIDMRFCCVCCVEFSIIDLITGVLDRELHFRDHFLSRGSGRRHSETNKMMLARLTKMHDDNNTKMLNNNINNDRRRQVTTLFSSSGGDGHRHQEHQQQQQQQQQQQPDLLEQQQQQQQEIEMYMQCVLFQLVKDTSQFVQHCIFHTGATLVDFRGDTVLCCMYLRRSRNKKSRLLTRFLLRLIEASKKLCRSDVCRCVFETLTKQQQEQKQKERNSSSSLLHHQQETTDSNNNSSVGCYDSDQQQQPQEQQRREQQEQQDSQQQEDGRVGAILGSSNGAEQQRDENKMKPSSSSDISSITMDSSRNHLRRSDSVLLLSALPAPVAIGACVSNLRLIEMGGDELHIARPVMFLGDALNDACRLCWYSRHREHHQQEEQQQQRQQRQRRKRAAPAAAAAASTNNNNTHQHHTANRHHSDEVVVVGSSSRNRLEYEITVPEDLCAYLGCQFFALRKIAPSAAAALGESSSSCDDNNNFSLSALRKMSAVEGPKLRAAEEGRRKFLSLVSVSEVSDV